MDWEGAGGLRVVIGDHVEIEHVLAVVLDDDVVDDCARTWVDHITVDFLEQSCRHILVNSDEQDLRVVVLVELSDGCLELAASSFVRDDLGLVARSTDTSSEHDGLLRPLVVLLRVSPEGLVHEVCQNLRSVLTDLRFLLLLGPSVLQHLLVHLLVGHT